MEGERRWKVGIDGKTVTLHLRAGATSCSLCYPARPRSRNSPEKEISFGDETAARPTCLRCARGCYRRRHHRQERRQRNRTSRYRAPPSWQHQPPACSPVTRLVIEITSNPTCDTDI